MSIGLRPTPPFPDHLPYQPEDVALIRRTRGCRRNCLSACVIPTLLLLAAMFMCGLVYVLFPPEPMDILILGLDARPGEGTFARTDSIMLLNISPASNGITLFSIPRDVFIEVPGYGPQRINTINLLGEQNKQGGGPELVRASINHSFDIEVDRTIRFDFDDFITLIDAIGGIDLYVSQTLTDPAYPTHDGGTTTAEFERGWHHLDGARALQYARIRHPDDDFCRAARQQQIVDALIKQLTDLKTLPRWPWIWWKFQQAFETDLSLIDILRVGPAIAINWHNKNRRVLERDDLIPMRAGYMVPDYAHLDEWIEQNFD